MATIMDAISEAVRETIDQGITDSLPKLDPVLANVVRTSQSVMRDNIGRDWKVKHTFSGALSGAHMYRSGGGADVTIDGSSGTGAVTVFGSGQSWQGVDEMAGGNVIQSTITLKRGMGNFQVPIHLLRIDKLDASVGPLVAEIVRGAAKRHSLSDVHAFWKLAATGNAIGKFTAAASSEDITNTSQSVTLTDGRIRSFYPGLFVDLYADNSGVPGTLMNTAAVVIVESVDYFAKAITLRTVATSDTVNLTASTAYWIVPGSKEGVSGNITSGDGTGDQSIAGLKDWIKTSGSVQGISLSAYPHFKSIVDTTNSGALESDTLNKYIAGFQDALGMELDTILTTTGVLMGFLENINSTQQLVRYDIQGNALKVEAGFQGVGYQFDGKVYKLATSPNCHTGKVFVIKLGDGNLKKYVPPRLPKAQSENRFAGEVEFVGPIFGSTNIFMPLHSNSNLTDSLQAPYENWCEYCMHEPMGIEIGTFDENVYTA